MYDLEMSEVLVLRSVNLDKREVIGIYDMVVPEKEPVVKYIRDTDKAEGPVVWLPDKDNPMKYVDENAPDVPMEDMESVPCETGIDITQLPH